MAPLMDDGHTNGTTADNGDIENEPRFLIIGAGSRGTAYAAAIVRSGLGIVAAVAEPITFKRQQIGASYIRGYTKASPNPEQEFNDWRDFIAYEQQRRKDAIAGLPDIPAGVDGVFVCVKDELHVHVVTALAPLGLHVMCEKPLATTLQDCLSIQRTLSRYPQRIFAIGHVLRYSPHNMLLRHLVHEQKVIGDVLSIEHTEPVGWWHFSHSYVRGQWRKENISAPSLLTKSCHDIDFVLWMLCSPPPGAEDGHPHLPATLSSAGSLKQYRRSRKPKQAGDATNCMTCPIRETCTYSAKKIYYDRHLARGNAKWPVDIVQPEIPHTLATEGADAAVGALFATLSEDYNKDTMPVADIEARPWFGRCVWESDNDVFDDQTVTIAWDDHPGTGLGAKTAIFHMIAQTLSQCERRGRIYGTSGEISYDSKSITVHNFLDGSTKVYHPEVPVNSHHGGGDDGLTECFVKAVIAAKAGEEGSKGGMSVAEAQRQFLGCDLEETVRSHAAVFAAEEARRERKVVEWDGWWRKNVQAQLESKVGKP